MTVSLLSKFKPSPYFLALKDEWIEFSYDSQELPLLEKIVEENDKEEIGINLLKRKGIHPSENEAIKEQHQSYLDASKHYFNLIKDVSDKTGLSRVEVQLRVSQDIEELEEEIKAAKGKAKEDNLDYLEIRKKIQGIKSTSQEESVKIAQILAPYNESITQATVAYNTSFNDYFIALIAYFLSGKRLQDKKVTFTVENVKNLHPDFRDALAGFITNELNGWSTEGK